MADGSGAVSTHSLRQKLNLAGEGHTRSAGSHSQHYAVNNISRRRRSPRVPKGRIFAAPLDRRTTGTRASCETKGGVPDRAVGGRAGYPLPPPRCLFPVRKVPGWRALGFSPGLWVATQRFRGVVAGAQEAREGGKASCFSGVYRLLWLPP